MKKLVAWVLALLMLTSMAACKSAGDSAGLEPGGLYVMTQASYYDADGNCYRRYNYTYDKFAQLTEVQQYANNNADGKLVKTQTETYTYDENGNYTSLKIMAENGVCYLSQQITWEYEAGLPVSYTLKDESSGIKSGHMEYTDGKLNSISERAFYEYDQQGRLIRERSGDYQVAQEKLYSYDGDRLVRVEYRSGHNGPTNLRSEQWDKKLKLLYSWDLEYEADRLVKVTCKDGRESLFWVKEYTYDEKGYPSGMVGTTCFTGAERAIGETYTCDQLGHIVKVQSSDGTRVEYTYRRMEVTAQQEANYWRREGARLGNSYPAMLAQNTVSDVWMYHLISNPLLGVFDLKLLVGP